MKRLFLYLAMIVTTTAVWAGPVSENIDEVLYQPASEFNCSKYGPDSVKAIQYYSLYREYFKQENYTEAMKYWPYVYKNAPALNVRVISNGMEYYTHLVETTEDPVQKDVYLDSLLLLIDHRIACQGGAVRYLSQKGNTLLKYRPSDKSAVRDIFGKAIEIGGDESPYYILENYFRMLLNDLHKGLVTPEEVLDIKDDIESIVNANANDEKYGARYAKALENIETLFENDPNVQKLFDCEAMKPTWEKQYREDPNDVDFVKDIYRKMSTKKCKDDPFTAELKQQLFVLDPTPRRYMLQASQGVKEKDYASAIEMIKKAIELEEDAMKKAEYNYKVAELNYVMKDFPTARSFAKKASALRPNWGKPYLLIGKLYASSGKLCGPGTGLESQRVIWPALDYFQRAKSVDPEVEEEAQELINKYWAYLPEKSEIFMQWGKGNGDSYFVPCWIQENTTIRAK